MRQKHHPDLVLNLRPPGLGLRPAHASDQDLLRRPEDIRPVGRQKGAIPTGVLRALAVDGEDVAWEIAQHADEDGAVA